MSDNQDDKEKIAELEAEVARLRQRLEPESETVRASSTSSADAEDLPAQPLGTASRGKVITFAVTVGLLALAAIIAVFVAISMGIGPFAKKMAKSFSPDNPSSQQGDRPASRPEGSPLPSGPSAPGL